MGRAHDSRLRGQGARRELIPGTAGRRAGLASALVLWIATTAALTLRPEPHTPPLTWGTFLCVGCGGTDIADVLANLILFLPGGALMAALMGARKGVACAAGITMIVELLQVAVPGRDPALQDLLANTLGALGGAVLVERGLGARGRLMLTGLAAVAWLAPSLLLVPRTSPADLYGLATPAFSTMERYPGEVLSAQAGRTPVPSGLLADKAGVDEAIVDRQPITILLRAGAHPEAVAPVFQIVDSRQRSVFSLLASGPDLLMFGHNSSQSLRLHQPEVRWRGAMDSVDEGDTALVIVDRSRGSMCVSVGNRTRCGLAPSLAEGWGLVAALGGARAWLRSLVSFGWVVGLGFLTGISARSMRSAAWHGSIFGLAGLGIATLSPDLRPELTSVLLLTTSSVLSGLWTERRAST